MVEICVKENDFRAVVAGNITGIVAEISLAIGNIYQSVKSTQGEEAADLFRIGMLVAMHPDSPAWEPHPGMVVINKK